MNNFSHINMKEIILLLILITVISCDCYKIKNTTLKEVVDTSKVEVKAVTDTTENKIPITFDVQLEDWENFNK